MTLNDAKQVMDFEYAIAARQVKLQGRDALEVHHDLVCKMEGIVDVLIWACDDNWKKAQSYKEGLENKFWDKLVERAN